MKLIDLDQLLKYPLRRESALCDEEHADPHFLNGVESVLEWAQTLPTLTPPNEWVSGVLVPCPGCGGDNIIDWYRHNGVWYQCNDCGWRGPADAGVVQQTAHRQCGISDVGKRDCASYSAVCNAGDSGGINE